jgi:hypothetical protein
MKLVFSAILRNMPGQANLIKLKKPVPLSFEGDYVTLHIPFEPAADPDWIKLFREADYPVSMEEPEVIGDASLRLTVQASKLEDNLSALLARVEATNEQFHEEVLPRREREAADAETEDQNRQRREADIRARLDAMWE